MMVLFLVLTWSQLAYGPVFVVWEDRWSPVPPPSPPLWRSWYLSVIRFYVAAAYVWLIEVSFSLNENVAPTPLSQVLVLGFVFPSHSDRFD